jgi:hypothetical protein
MLREIRRYTDSVLANKLLKRILGPERVEVTAGRKKLLNEELHSLYSSLHIRGVVKSKIMELTSNKQTKER